MQLLSANITREAIYFRGGFFERLDQIKPHTDYIYLHVKGEPLLHPKIGQLLDISHEKGFKVNITTNGTLINKKEGKIIK